MRTFDLDNLDELMDFLDDYSKSLDEKAKLITEKLADRGIEVAESRIDGSLGRYVTFYKEFENEAIILCASSETKTVMWETKEGIKSADISPVLMCEFGSGLQAENDFINLKDIGGTGKFPGQTHAENPNGWWFKSITEDGSGRWMHSKGITPSRPMYYAYKDILENIVEVVKEVFGNVG